MKNIILVVLVLVYVPHLMAQKFSIEQVPQDIDVVVIGSGMGGMMAAGILAKSGKRVVLLERLFKAGGCTHTFKRGKLDRVEMDTGLHYLGKNAFESQTGPSKFLNSISTKDRPIKWARMPEVFDIVRFDDSDGDNFTEFKVRAGRQNFINDLISRFPNEKEAISSYFEFVDDSQKASPSFFIGTLLPAFLGNILKGPFHKYSDRTLDEVLQEITSDPHLRAILAYSWGNSGRDPREISFANHAMVVKHYEDGSIYPKGGPSVIADTIVPFIQAHNGSKVFTKAPVSKILTDENKNVRGVEVKQGDQRHFIPCKKVISTIGVIQTNKLIEENLQTPSKDLPRPSVSHMILFLTFDGPLLNDEVKANTWIFPSEDYAFNLDNFNNDPLNKNIPFPGVFVSFPSLKDPTWDSRSGTKLNTCQVIVPIPYEVFKSFEGTKPGSRGDEYLQLKESFEKRIFLVLKKHFPQVYRNKVKWELSTPLTSAYFLGSADGSSYGAVVSPARYRKLACTPNTHISGLYLGGQDVLSPGITGALVGGIFGAAMAFPLTVSFDNFQALLAL